jgi:hypothetical protein
VRERKRQQQQLQTIQSQEQMMAENYDKELKIDPTPLCLQNPVQEFNWESIGATQSQEYVPPLPSLSRGTVGQRSYGATAAGNIANFDRNKSSAPQTMPRV